MLPPLKEIPDSALSHRVESDPVLRLFLNSIKDQAVFSIDPNGIILTWSEGCQTMKLYTPEEAIGHHFQMLYTQEDQDRGHPEDNLRRALEEGQYHEERVRLRKGGLPFMADVSIYPIEEEGQFAGFAKVVRDISARKLLEDKLAGANLQLEGFCSSVAHDLHTPIRTIVSMGTMIKQDFAPNLPDEARDYLDTMIKSSRRLSRLVDDLLDFARLGQGELKRQDVDASAMVRELVAEIAPLCQGGTGHIEVQDGIHANADSSMLEFVLRNLIENACKYSRLDVKVRFGMDMVDGKSVYRIHDDGIGFEMRFADKIFEPFQRLHGTEKYAGSGIGLANVRRIVERHGGKVWAESELGKGSTFFFTLE
jgi:PAS domain S-box-containing protein